MSEFEKKSKPATQPAKPDNGDIPPYKPKRVRARGVLYEIMYNESMAKIDRGVCTFPMHSVTRKKYRAVNRISKIAGIKIVEIQGDNLNIESSNLVNGKYKAEQKGIIVQPSKVFISDKNKNIVYKNACAIEVVSPSIEKRAFNGHINLIWLYLHGVKSIGDNAFSNCCHLKYVYISDSLEKIGSNIFDGCNSIIINYLGTKAQWDKIIKDNDWAGECNSIEIKCKNGIIKKKMKTKKKQLKKKK